MPTEGQASKQVPVPTAKLAEIEFRDRSGALRNFEAISKRVPAGVSGSISSLLSDLPDPDAALNAFERLTESAGAEALRLLDRHRPLIHYALAVFSYSRFLGETLIQNPDLFQIFQREKSRPIVFSRGLSRGLCSLQLAIIRYGYFEAAVPLQTPGICPNHVA